MRPRVLSSLLVAEKERRVRAPATLARMRRDALGTLMRARDAFRPVVETENFDSTFFSRFRAVQLHSGRRGERTAQLEFSETTSNVNEIIPAGS